MSGPNHIHIVGAGLAGLSAALQLTLMGERVTVYEAAPFAGGRCRSYMDRGLGCRIDNGNHLVFSGNVATHDYLFLTQAADSMTGPGAALFPFMDLESKERWTIDINDGFFPKWIFNKNRRVPNTKVSDYLSSIKLLAAGKTDMVSDFLDPNSDLYRRFWKPLVISALNIEPATASASLLRNLFMQSFAAGGKSCHPLMPKIGMSESFVMPCLNVLRQHGSTMRFGHRIRSMVVEDKRVKELNFGDVIVELDPNDWVILALPPWVVQEMIPDLTVPNEFCAILNAHYRVEVPKNISGFTGLIGGMAEWSFVKDGVVSVTISAADRYDERHQHEQSRIIWRDLAKLYDLDPEKVPPYRMLREKRATIAATPWQNLRRPRAYIGWKNLALAGEWTDTGLPSTIEGAIRSGVKAAQIVERWKD
ncbi:MAG: hydroxysqualene dehydroxylase HpnE [Alphaproteobacteria bacterium]|nr:hydroxysqualene dehydroxylase HpnE [Alphaproteobacteria bacterium]